MWRHDVHLIFSPAGLGRVEVKSPQVELLAFGEEGMDFGGSGGLLDGQLVGLLVGLLVGQLVLRLVGGLGEVVWLWRVGGGEESAEKLVVGELLGQDEDEQVVRSGHAEVGQNDDDEHVQVGQQRDVQGGCREGIGRTKRGRELAPGQEGTFLLGN